MSKKPQLSLDALRIIDAIDRFGSFAAAANHLHKVPSAITYSVQKLEEELDTMIFDRSGHKTQFTKAGLFLLEQGRLVLNTADELGETVQAIASGWESQLTIVSEVLYASHLLYPFVRKLNEVSKTQLTIRTEVLSGAFEALRSGQADVLIAVDSPEHDVIEINKKKIKTLDVVYVAKPGHPIFDEQDPCDELTREQYQGIVIADTANHYTALTRHVLPKQPRLVVSSLYEKRIALIDGLGVATMPYYFIKEDIDAGRLKIIGCKDGAMKRDLMMFWRRDNMGKAKTLALKLLPDIVKQSLAEFDD